MTFETLRRGFAEFSVETVRQAHAALSTGLTPGSWVEVEAITTQPSGWTEPMAHQGDGAYFVLRGARDSREVSLCLFPEILKSDYHGIRAAIEAYSRTGRVAGGASPSGLAPACGLAMQKSSALWGHTVRVTTRGGVAKYTLDRWD